MIETRAAPTIVTAEEADAGARLDRVLADRVEGLSRSRAQALIKAGAVTRGQKTLEDPGARVKPGDTFELQLPEPEAAVPTGENIALDVVYEDKALIVIDKPAGLVVHPSAGHATGTLVNALIAHCGETLSGIGGVRRPGIVHRLDKDTSGLLVVAKTDKAHQGLAAQFAAHGSDGRLSRRYVAVVWGTLVRRSGLVDAPLGRSTTNRTKIAIDRGMHGRAAVTHYQVAETFTGADGKPVASLIHLELATGRTHQIRVHMAHIGHPVMGDPTYGAGFKASAAKLTGSAASALDALARQALHATSLAFEHPVTRKKLSFERPPPDDMTRLIEALRRNGGASAMQPLPPPESRL